MYEKILQIKTEKSRKLIKEHRRHPWSRDMHRWNFRYIKQKILKNTGEIWGHLANGDRKKMVVSNFRMKVYSR